jgi:hypothetical protein
MNRKDPSDCTKNFDTEELAKSNANLRAEIIRYKQTEQALRRSEVYLAEAERLSHTGSWAYETATGVPVYWSLERRRISKFDPAKGHPTLEEYRQLHAAEDWEKLMEATDNQWPDSPIAYVVAGAHFCFLPPFDPTMIRFISLS